MSQAEYSARLARERDFHNNRFGAPEARKEDSFYFAAQAAMDFYWGRVRETAIGKEVLEYGCASGAGSIGLARLARHVTGIDLSDVAIAQAREEARRRSVANVTFKVANAENTGLPSESFDLVFGSGILQQLELLRSVAEVRRLTRSGGTAIFFEPLGHHPAINLYRHRTPGARTPDEHPLLQADFDVVRGHFSRCDLEFFGLAALASIPFRRSPLGAAIRAAGTRLDTVLLKLPGLKWQAWIVVMVLEA